MPFAALFTDDPMVRKLGAEYLQINAVCEPFLALGMVLTGALQGAGDTVRPGYITIFTMWIVRMQVTWLLMFALGLQTRGAWISTLFTTIIGGPMTTALFAETRSATAFARSGYSAIDETDDSVDRVCLQT